MCGKCAPFMSHILIALTLATTCLLASASAQEAPPPTRRHGAPALLPEPRAMTIALDFASGYLGGEAGEWSEGFYPVFEGIITGSGWISLGGGYRVRLLDDRALVDGSATVSWRGYKTAQARFEFTHLAGGHLTAGSQLVWQDLTQMQYYGLGPDSSVTDRADYRLQSTNLVGYARFRPTRWLSVDAQGGRLSSPTLSASAGWFDRGYPDVMTIFAESSGLEPKQEPPFLHGQLAITVDTRDYPGHPSSGGVYRAAWSSYSDRDLTAYSFRRYEAEAAQFVPLARERWTLALHGWVVTSENADGQRIPIYALPSLGGANTLRSYADYRFHDRSLLLVSAESRWALFTHVDAALFVDAGSVASRPRELSLADRSYGAGVRVHAHSSTTLRLDVAHGREGWRVLFRLKDPFRLGRLSRRAAAIPFVP